jgi:hypothetical protein
MHPYRPLQLPDSTVMREVWHDIEDEMLRMNDLDVGCEVSPAHSPKTAWERVIASANTTKITNAGYDTSSMSPLDQIQLAVSFRADLPSDVPPTMSSECVKYFYTAVLLVTTADGEVGIHVSSFCKI